MSPSRIRWKLGTDELEIEGDPEFIAEQLDRFLEARGSTPIREEPASAPIHVRPAPQETQASIREARELTPAEYMRQKNPQTGTEQLIVLAKYLEDSSGKREFKMADINKLARDAKVKDIHSQYFTYAVKQGLLRSVAKGTYSITLSGEDAVLALPKAAKSGQ